MSEIGWGIVGPGEIAEVFAASLAASKAGRVVGVLGRSQARTQAFCRRSGGRAFSSLDALLNDPEIQAVYVATPHPAHALFVSRALEAGRAVLCEKPLSAHGAETAGLIRHAEALGGLLREAWMYRCHPQITRLGTIIASGSLGRPLRFSSRFCFAKRFDPEHRLFDAAQGGGAIWDVGGYPLSLAMFCAGASARKLPAHRIQSASAAVACRGVDARARARVVFEGGMVADIEAAVDHNDSSRTLLECEKGRVRLEEPFLPEGCRRGLRGVLHVEEDSGDAWSEVLDADHDVYGLEALAMRSLILDRNAETPLPTLEESLAIGKALQSWRDLAGLSGRTR